MSETSQQVQMEPPRPPAGQECADEACGGEQGGQKNAAGPAGPMPGYPAMGGYAGPHPGWWAPPYGYYPGPYGPPMGQGYAPAMPAMGYPGPAQAPPPPQAEAQHGKSGGHGGSEGCSCHEQAGAGAMEQNQMGKMFGLMGDIVSGKANASTVTSLLGGCSDQFWKGALVGAGLAFLLTNPTVRQGLTGLWGGLFGGAKAEDEPCAAPAGEE
ncbi:hypothetical protein [Desulfarculus baarsii]